MDSGILYPLIPKPIEVQNEAFSGRLLVDGNIINNLLLFSFQFDTVEAVSPLCVQVEVLEQVYLYFCTIRDFANSVMKTRVIKPEFNLKNKIRILRVEPLISIVKLGESPPGLAE